jgi:signal transduction histidine kinase
LLLLVIIAFIVIRNIQLKRQVAVTLEKHKGEQQKLQAIEGERSRISAELHDDVGGEISAIRLLSEMDIPTINPLQQLSKISTSSAILIQKMNEIVWSLNVNNDSLQSLIAYIQNYASKYLDSMDIDCTFSQPGKIPDIELSGNTRRNIFLIVKESLNNVSKHSEAKKVDIKILAEESLFIYINDNGKGIIPGASNIITGNGFKNMRSRVKEMNGSMEVINNNGTSLNFILPVLNTNTKG